MQSPSISLEIAARNIKHLGNEMTNLREQWQAIISEAKHVANEMAILVEFKTSRRRKRPRRYIADSDASDDHDENKVRRRH